MTENTIKETLDWKQFGPNGRSVLALIEKIENMTEPQLEQVANIWKNISPTSWNDAWKISWQAARDIDLLVIWGDAGRITWDDAWDETENEYSILRTAWAATTDAIRAVMVRNLIPESHFHTFVEPIESVLGPVPNIEGH